MSKETEIQEEVPTNNISSGAVVDPMNRPLGRFKDKKNPKHPNSTTRAAMLYRRWRAGIDMDSGDDYSGD